MARRRTSQSLKTCVRIQDRSATLAGLPRRAARASHQRQIQDRSAMLAVLPASIERCKSGAINEKKGNTKFPTESMSVVIQGLCAGKICQFLISPQPTPPSECTKTALKVSPQALYQNTRLALCLHLLQQRQQAMWVSTIHPLGIDGQSLVPNNRR